MSSATTRRDWTPLVFVSAFVVSALVLALGLVAARRHAAAVYESRRVERADALRRSCEERGALFVPRVAGALPLADATSPRWDAAPTLEVRLQRQTIAMPMLAEATVETARLQGLTDGERIALRVTWLDPTVDANVDTGRFTDAVALQFPLERNAAFSMGSWRRPVEILHWKALWQRDVDEHFQDVQDLHPNYWADLYWFAEGRPYRVPDSFADPVSHQWFTGYSAGNPLSDFHRAVPIEELAAEGYGSLTEHDEAVAVGGGARLPDGRWAVVFSRPLRTDDPLDYQFAGGSTGQLGVAVWDGSGGNVGGRKHWSDWVGFGVSP